MSKIQSLSLSAMKIILHSLENDSRPIYITGSFNAWNPADKNCRLRPLPRSEWPEDITEGKCYSIELNPGNDAYPIDCKFTKGGWESVEIDSNGNITPNRQITQAATSHLQTVERWRYNWGPHKAELMPTVELISDEFLMPQLQKTRKVWALLPADYYTTTKKYPVLYLHDAQNLFDEKAPFGNWEIDKKMAVLAEYGRGDLIIIAIENGHEDRINEYILDANTIAKNAAGKKYIRFLADTLKPYVDSVYRTLPEREHTGIGGSSLGGLISIYSGFLYPEVYSKLMIFSPSLWLNPMYDFPLLNFKYPFNTKIYMYGGAKEGSRMVEHIQEFRDLMEYGENIYSVQFDFKVSINPEGKHQEFYWSQEFPKAIEWLFFNSLEDPAVLARLSRR